MSTFGYRGTSSGGRYYGMPEGLSIGSAGGLEWTMRQKRLSQTDNVYGSGFDQGFQGGQRERRAMLAATSIQANRRAGMTSVLQDFQTETTRFNREYEAATNAMDAVNQRFSEGQAKIAGVLENLDKAPSKASSIGQFSSMAQAQMQDTQLALNRLSGMKAPSVIDVPTKFIDPFSGEEVMLDAKFEDLYDAPDAGAVARQAVIGKFEKARDSIRADIDSQVETHYGASTRTVFGDQESRSMLERMSQHMQDLDNKRMGRFQGTADYMEAQKRMMDYGSQYSRDIRTLKSKGIDIGSDNPWHPASGAKVNKLLEGVAYMDNMDKYSEAAAMAVISGDDKMMSYKAQTGGLSGKKHYINPAEFYFDADINAELDKMVKYTESKLNLEFKQEGANYEAEFDKRRNRALQQVEAAERNKELNRIRSGEIDAQKRGLQQRLEKQQQEYASAMAGLKGGGGSGSSSITFSETRPS